MYAIRSFLIGCALVPISTAVAQAPCDSLLHADFLATPYPLDGHDIGLINTTTSADPGNTIYTWDFGDGSQASGDVGMYGYQAYGTYTICVTAVLGACSDTACTTIEVVAAQQPCAQLDPTFSTTSFDTTAWFQQHHQVNDQSFTWDFGDGSGNTGLDPTHVYSTYGTYEVCLTASTWNPFTQSMCSAQDCEFITITPAPHPCAFIDTVFTANVSGTIVSYTHPMVSDLINYLWILGDDSLSTEPVVTHTYAAPGQYYVCLVESAIDPGMQEPCVSEYCQWVEVQDLSTAIADRSEGEAPSAYPQPFEGSVTIVDAAPGADWRLLDLAGRSIATGRVPASGRCTIDGAGLPSGVYVLHMHNGTRTAALRLVKH